jgi:predicted oxidoreductase (fatty acid repression mutant protein)
MKWMMGSMDLQNRSDKINGFQASNIAIRFYLMDRELHQLKAKWSNEDFDKFAPFQNSLSNGALTVHNFEAQTFKANRFIDVSIEMNHKHFSRWCKKSMLPFGLLAEWPLAMQPKDLVSATLTREQHRLPTKA